MKNDPAEVERFSVVGQPRRQAGSSRMSVDITSSPSGLTVVDRHHAASARPRRSASGPASAAATRSRTSTASRICSNTWRSRAPRGARARSSRRSRRSAAISTPATSTETTAYYARVMKADVAAGARRASGHPRQSRLRSGRTGAREGRDRAGNRRGAGYALTTSCSSISTSSAIRTSRWAARCSAPRRR